MLMEVAYEKACFVYINVYGCIKRFWIDLYLYASGQF